MSKFRQACSIHFWRFEIEQNPVVEDCQTFVSFFGLVVPTFRHFLGKRVDKVRAIFGGHSIFVCKRHDELNYQSRSE